MEKVSVIIPCYNSGKTIEQTVKSIEKQTWSNIELIIVNDGSDDDYTLNVLSKFKNAKIIYQKNSGLSSARNKGLANAKGNYVFFLDADDWIEIDAISKMMECMKYSNSSILFPDTILEDERKGLRKKNYNFFEQLFINHIPYCFLIEKKIFEKVGNYDEEMKVGYEDWEFNIRLAKAGLFPKRIEQPLFHYRVSKYGMLNSISKKNHFDTFDYIKKKHLEIYTFNNLFRTYLKWRKKKMNYHILLYIMIYSTSNLLSIKLCNKILGLISKLIMTYQIKS